MNKEIYNDSLKNTPVLDLGSIHLRYFGTDNLPNLVTVYELVYPINIALNSIQNNLNELENDELGNGAIKGLFVLGLSNFEILLNDILTRFLAFYPQKLVEIKDADKTRKENSEYQMSKDGLFSGEPLNVFIKTKLDKLFYSDIEKILKTFNKLLCINIEINENEYSKLIEIKESRNLLLHNNLVVNEKYLKKTKDFKRSTKPGTTIAIDKEYSLDSLRLIRNVIQKIETEILKKYSKYTMLNLFNLLWRYTFKDHIKIEDYFELNIDRDSYDGPLKNGRFDISSSETLFLQIWIAQRFGRGIDNFGLVQLTPDNSRKVAILTEVFGNLRLTYW